MRSKRKWVAALILLVIVPTLVTLFAIPPLALLVLSPLRNGYCGGLDTIVAPSVVTPVTADGLSIEQKQNASIIIGVGISLGLSKRAIGIAISTAMQESELHNLSYGDKDSLGLFQQRPSQGWGTPEQLTDPVYASNKFYAVLIVEMKKDSSRSDIDLAIAVQRPNRSAYEMSTHNFYMWATMTSQLLASVPETQLSNTATATAAPMVYDSICAVNPGAPVNAEGWTSPLTLLHVGSPYGQRFHPILHYWRLHDGVDLSGEWGDPVYAMHSGTIIAIASEPSGAGNYMRIDYGDGNIITYMHLQRYADVHTGMLVTAGQTVAYVGSTGLSTGPHLHVMWRINGTSTNPVPQMCARGIQVPGPLGCSVNTN